VRRSNSSATPRDPFIREKFTKESTAARDHAKDYFKRFPKERYRTEVESWRKLQSQNIEFTMKRLREPIDDGSAPGNAGLI
jgi:hypothetical protein